MRNTLKIVSYCIDPEKFLGRSIKVVLKGDGVDRPAFQFKVTGCGGDWFEGYDEERLNLRLFFDDIDFIVGAMN